MLQFRGRLKFVSKVVVQFWISQHSAKYWTQKKVFFMIENIVFVWTAMDKSVNNFDDVDDTMSSVYNAWRKQSKPRTKKNLYLDLSISLPLFLFASVFLWVSLLSFFFGTYLILINSEQWDFFFLLIIHLLDSLILKIWKPQSPNPFIPLTTQISSHKKKTNFEFLSRRNAWVGEFEYGREALRPGTSSAGAARGNLVAQVDSVGSAATAQQSRLQFITHIIVNVLLQLLWNNNQE